MDKSKSYIAKHLVFILSLMILFTSVPVANASENETAVFSTIYINDNVFSKHRLYSVLENEDVILLPAAAFSEVEGISSKDDKDADCYIFERDDGRYISINLGSSTYYNSEGNNAEIKTDFVKSEYYFDASIICKSLGLLFDVSEYGGKTVTRIISSDTALSFDVLIKNNVISEATIVNTPLIKNTNPLDYDKAISFVFDLTLINHNGIRQISDLSKELGIKASFVIDEVFLKNSLYSTYLYELNASGHSFILKKTEASSKSLEEQAEYCNKILYQLFFKKTNLIYAESISKKMSNNGYIAVNNLTDISSSISTGSAVKKGSVYLIDSVSENEIDYLRSAVDYSTKKKLRICEINPYTGK